MYIYIKVNHVVGCKGRFYDSLNATCVEYRPREKGDDNTTYYGHRGGDGEGEQQKSSHSRSHEPPRNFFHFSTTVVRAPSDTSAACVRLVQIHNAELTTTPLLLR